MRRKKLLTASLLRLHFAVSRYYISILAYLFSLQIGTEHNVL